MTTCTIVKTQKFKSVLFVQKINCKAFFISLEDFISTENLVPPLYHNNYIILALEPSL